MIFFQYHLNNMIFLEREYSKIISNVKSIAIHFLKISNGNLGAQSHKLILRQMLDATSTNSHLGFPLYLRTT